MTRIEFELPWPPSVNHYYRYVGPRVLISRDGRKYRELVSALLKGSGKVDGNIALTAHFYPPDRRRRDLDNIGGKVLLDTLQAAGMYDDDSQIKEIHLRMLDPVENGRCFVKLEQIGENKTCTENNAKTGTLSCATSSTISATP